MSSDYMPLAAVPEKLNLPAGSVLLVHSDVLRWAKAARAHHEVFDLDLVIESFQRVLGEQGTLLFPAFNYEFCEGKPFDIRTTPSVTGALSRTALKRKDFMRTAHPIYSFAVWGRYAKPLAQMRNQSAFGKDSPFGFLHQADACMLIIDLAYNHAFTFVHYVEEQKKAPYRYLKKFTAPYVDEEGRKTLRTYSMYVRDLEKGVLSDTDLIGALLEKKGIALVQTVNGIVFKCVGLAKAYTEIARDIRQNEGRLLHRVGSCPSGRSPWPGTFRNPSGFESL